MFLDYNNLAQEFTPRFLRRYANVGEQITSAIEQYVKDVRDKDFPNSEEQY